MRRALLGLASAASILGLALWPVVAPSATARADTPVPNVSLSAATGLTDGEAVIVTVTTSPDVPVSQATARECRGGVTYQPSTGFRPAPDFEAQGPNCPGASNPVSSSADASVTDSNTFDNAPKPGGETFLFRVGSGVVNWQDTTSGHQVSLTCDETHACDLVVELLYQPDKSSPAQWKPFAIPISFAVSDPIAGCGGAADDALQTGGSDRMQDAWVAWTLGTCALHPSVHAPGRGTFVGEGAAITGFANGALDLAYTAGGYDGDMAKGSTASSGLTSADLTRRPAVAVPVALNAAVVGVGGGVRVDATHKSPYKDLKLIEPELAAMLGGGVQGVPQGSPLYESILDRNPELKQTDLFDPSAGFSVGAPADAEATSWYATRWLEEKAAGSFKVPNIPNLFGADAGKSRGIDAALALAAPGYNNALALLSGRPALRKGLIGPGPNSQGGVWVLTDAETAATFGMTPVQVPDSTGTFVGPTAAALDAAVPAMKPDDQGILVSDPKALPAGAYPLTMVEYALVPAQPLLNDDCTVRTGAEKLLTDWLGYVTTDGQAKLPVGMAPLPDSLKAQAAASIQKVGASPVTGKCANATQPPTIAPAAAAAPALPGASPVLPAPAVGAPLPASGGGADFTQPPTLDAGTPASALASGGAAEAAPAVQADTSAKIPAFAGRRATSWAGPVLALVGVVALSSLALVATTKPAPR